ncbi:MAG: SH3 domain-containing protein [Oscillospiraceae bacterium]|nr:SH3 domain-containing protein [Oscillospiraceae bacterium]
MKKTGKSLIGIFLVLSLCISAVMVGAAADTDDPIYDINRSESAAVDDNGIALTSVKATEEIYAYGVDVSAYQKDIDWYRVAQSGVTFAIIRVGYRGYGSSGKLVQDEYAIKNIEGALANGINVGCYFFSTAVNEAEAVEEAKFVVNIIKNYDITYPVVYDCEGYDISYYRNYGLSNTLRSNMAIAFLDYVESCGYEGMMYSCSSHLNNNAYWNTSTLESKYQVWVAHYMIQYTDSSGKKVEYPTYESSINAGKTLPYSGAYRFWQFTSQGQVDGIYCDVDLSFEYCSTGTTESGKSGNAVSSASASSTYTTYTTTDNVNVRTGPGTGYSIVTTLSANTEVLVEDGYIAVANGIPWYRVLIDGQTYYMSGNYLKAPASSNATTYSTYTVTANSANVRTGPGTSYSVAMTLSAGTKVQVEDHYYSEANGYIWYRVLIDGNNYYMSFSTLTAVTDDGTINPNLTSGDVVNMEYNGEDGWWYVVDGEVRTDYTGVASHANAYGWWYIRNGKVDFSYTGLAKNYYGWWYVDGGKVIFAEDSVVQGTVNGSDGWYEVVGGQVQLDHTGVSNVCNDSGWWYVKNGKVDFSKNSVEQNNYGWWYVNGGKVNFAYTGVGDYSNNYGWWYIKDGKVDFSETSVEQNRYGWWRVVDGKVDFSCNSVEQNQWGWWYLLGGEVQFGYTGVADYANAYGWWYINEGKVDFSVTSVEQNKNGWWYVENGKVIFSYTGWASNRYGSWYCVNGKVDFSKS